MVFSVNGQKLVAFLVTLLSLASVGRAQVVLQDTTNDIVRGASLPGNAGVSVMQNVAGPSSVAEQYTFSSGALVSTTGTVFSTRPVITLEIMARVTSGTGTIVVDYGDGPGKVLTLDGQFRLYRLHLSRGGQWWIDFLSSGSNVLQLYGWRVLDGAFGAEVLSGDTTPPPVPIVVDTSIEDEVSISWSGSDPDAVSYQVTLDSVVVATVNGTNYSFGKKPLGQYVVGVRAFDAAGNQSLLASITVTAEDTIPPAVPDALTVIAAGQSAVASWQASPGAARYRLKRGTNQVYEGVSASYGDAVNAPGTFGYAVAAVDASGNVSGFSGVVFVTLAGGADAGGTGDDGGFPVLVFSEQAPGTFKVSWTGGAAQLDVDGQPSYRGVSPKVYTGLSGGAKVVSARFVTSASAPVGRFTVNVPPRAASVGSVVAGGSSMAPGRVYHVKRNAGRATIAGQHVVVSTMEYWYHESGGAPELVAGFNDFTPEYRALVAQFPNEPQPRPSSQIKVLVKGAALGDPAKDFWISREDMGRMSDAGRQGSSEALSVANDQGPGYEILSALWYDGIPVGVSVAATPVDNADWNTTNWQFNNFTTALMTATGSSIRPDGSRVPGGPTSGDNGTFADGVALVPTLSGSTLAPQGYDINHTWLGHNVESDIGSARNTLEDWLPPELLDALPSRHSPGYPGPDFGPPPVANLLSFKQTIGQTEHTFTVPVTVDALPAQFKTPFDTGRTTARVLINLLFGWFTVGAVVRVIRQY